MVGLERPCFPLHALLSSTSSLSCCSSSPPWTGTRQSLSLPLSRRRARLVQPSRALSPTHGLAFFPQAFSSIIPRHSPHPLPSTRRQRQNRPTRARLSSFTHRLPLLRSSLFLLVSRASFFFLSCLVLALLLKKERDFPRKRRQRATQLTATQLTRTRSAQPKNAMRNSLSIPYQYTKTCPLVLFLRLARSSTCMSHPCSSQNPARERSRVIQNPARERWRVIQNPARERMMEGGREREGEKDDVCMGWCKVTKAR